MNIPSKLADNKLNEIKCQTKLTIDSKKLFKDLTGMDYSNHPAKNLASKTVPLSLFDHAPKTLAHDRNLSRIYRKWITHVVKRGLKLGIIQPGDKLPPHYKLATYVRAKGSCPASHKDVIEKTYNFLEEQKLVWAGKGTGTHITNQQYLPKNFNSVDAMIADIREFWGNQPDSNRNQPIRVRQLAGQLLDYRAKRTEAFIPTPWTDKKPESPSLVSTINNISEALHLLALEGLVSHTGANSYKQEPAWVRSNQTVHRNSNIWQGHTRSLTNYMEQTLKSLYLKWPINLPLPPAENMAKSAFTNASVIRNLLSKHQKEGLLARGKRRNDSWTVIPQP